MGEESLSISKPSRRPIVLAILIGAIIIAIGLAVGLAIGLTDDDSDDMTKVSNEASTGDNNGDNSGEGHATTKHFKSATGTYHYASVVTDSDVCSTVGTDIMGRKRGNAIDAAVAATFCIGLLNAHSAGVGGGIFITIYDSVKKEWHAVNGRETAPGASTENMYGGKGGRMKAFRGGLASGVPGEVLALYEVHRRMGKLPWADVVRPSLKMAQDGVPLSKATHAAVASLTTDKQKQDFSYYFDENGNIKPVGSLNKMPKLARTLQTIMDDPMSFYNGSLAQDIAQDNQDEDGIITAEDLKNYRLKWTRPTMLSMPGGYKLFSIPAPGSGPVLSYILNILAGYNMSPSSVEDEESKILTFHRMVEAFKFAYGKRAQMGDEDFVDIAELVTNMTTLSFGEATRALIDDTKTHSSDYYMPTAANDDDQGTTHLSVIDGQGNAVAISDTINGYFGSGVKGSLTGIVFNNEMADFSTPNTTGFFGNQAPPNNFPEPGKRPQSSMCPSIIWDSNHNRVRMITGASGGSRITTTVAKNILDVLYFGRPLAESVDGPRMHHQLFPNDVYLEANFSKVIEEGLRAKGHGVRPFRGISVVQAIDVTEDGIVGVADYRKGGAPDGF